MGGQDLAAPSSDVAIMDPASLFMAVVRANSGSERNLTPLILSLHHSLTPNVTLSMAAKAVLGDSKTQSGSR